MVERISPAPAGPAAIPSNDAWSVSVNVQNPPLYGGALQSIRNRKQSGSRSGGGNGNPYSPGRQGFGRGEEGGVDVAMSAAVLHADNIAEILDRVGQTIRLLTVRLLDVGAADADELVARFTDAGLEALRQAIIRYMEVNRGGKRPFGLTFEDVELRADPEGGRVSMSVGAANFVDRLDFRATGVVFDLSGSTVVQDPRPGIFVDTGEHGAVNAALLTDRVRRDLPDFGTGADTQNVIVLIRAERSDYRDRLRTGKTLDFDLLIPYADFAPAATRGSSARDNDNVSFEA